MAACFALSLSLTGCRQESGPVAPKASGVVPYTIDGAVEQSGTFVVDNAWPGQAHPDDWTVGENWWTDVRDPSEFEGDHQGAKTVARWRDTALRVWAERCQSH